MEDLIYQRFTVTWRGDFPLDMLRYDACYPFDQQAVAVIYDSLKKFTPEARSVTLQRIVSDREDLPTHQRWESFGAQVSHVTTY